LCDELFNNSNEISSIKFFTKEKVLKLQIYENRKNRLPYTCCSHNGCNRDENYESKLLLTINEMICSCGKYIQIEINNFYT
jgi:hypothetical protein